MTQPSRYPEVRQLRRLIWGFTRNSVTGLPPSKLLADSQWHPELLARIKTLLVTIENEYGLKPTGNLGNKLNKRGLTNAPLMAADDLIALRHPRIRISTVHQVKGESLDAVLYMATKEHVKELLAGVDTEVGRIGYVALTRTKNLFWLGVPANTLKELKPTLIDHGFQEVVGK